MNINLNNINTCKKLSEKIKNATSFLIIGHVAPDGDVLGSMLALREALLQLDTTYHVDTLLVGEVPDIYKFLPGSEHFIPYDSPLLLKEYDMAIAVDVASQERMGPAANILNLSSMTAQIDHHESNPFFADINYVDAQVSATGELIFHLINELGLTFTKDIATNIYAAILTDTGGFKFSNTTVSALNTCSKLIAYGAEPQKIYQECYENKPLPMALLHSHCVSNIKLSHDKKIAWSTVTRQMLENFKATDDHIDGIVELLRQIDTVLIALIFKETKYDKIKISFRSKDIDICPLAKSYNGGGHKYAAGCTLDNATIEEAIDIIIPKVENYLKSIQP